MIKQDKHNNWIISDDELKQMLGLQNLILIALRVHQTQTTQQLREFCQWDKINSALFELKKMGKIIPFISFGDKRGVAIYQLNPNVPFSFTGPKNI